MTSPSDIPTLLWVVGFQMGVYTLMWVLSLVLLKESRVAVAHWVLFMALLGLGLVLAGLRTEPRQWWPYNGTNVATLLGFALMRRGTEHFMGLPRRDLEQLSMLLPALALLIWLGPEAEHAALRVVLVYALQCVILARTLITIRPALLREFGAATMRGIVLPGGVLAAVLALFALRQVWAWPVATEMHTHTWANVGQVFTYLGGTALFCFAFLTLVTQRLLGRLHEASMHDALTGLFNRRAMNEALTRAWLRHRRSGAPLAALVIDLDHFKRINDSAGHAAGDAVLVRVAGLLQAQLRAEDVLGRAGGEEFWLILPDTPSAHALLLAERLRKVVDEAAVGTTCSVGVALAAAEDADASQLIARADAALYRAKDEGRNRVKAA